MASAFRSIFPGRKLFRPSPLRAVPHPGAAGGFALSWCSKKPHALPPVWIAPSNPAQHQAKQERHVCSTEPPLAASSSVGSGMFVARSDPGITKLRRSDMFVTTPPQDIDPRICLRGCRRLSRRIRVIERGSSSGRWATQIAVTEFVLK